jgi:hypothetical protein
MIKRAVGLECRTEIRNQKAKKETKENWISRLGNVFWACIGFYLFVFSSFKLCKALRALVLGRLVKFYIDLSHITYNIFRCNRFLLDL